MSGAPQVFKFLAYIDTMRVMNTKDSSIYAEKVIKSQIVYH